MSARKGLSPSEAAVALDAVRAIRAEMEQLRDKGIYPVNIEVKDDAFIWDLAGCKECMTAIKGIPGMVLLSGCAQADLLLVIEASGLGRAMDTIGKMLGATGLGPRAGVMAIVLGEDDEDAAQATKFAIDAVNPRAVVAMGARAQAIAGGCEGRMFKAPHHATMLRGPDGKKAVWSVVQAAMASLR